MNSKPALSAAARDTLTTISSMRFREQTMKNILAKYNVSSLEELNILYQKNLATITEEAAKYDSYINDITEKLRQIEGYVNVQ